MHSAKTRKGTIMAVHLGALSPTRHSWWSLGLPPLLLVLALADALTGLALSGIGEVLPTLHAQWHAGYDQLGVALGLLRLASLGGALWIGPRLDRLPAEPLLIGVFALFALSWAMLPLADSLLAAVPVFVLIGVATGANAALVTAVAPRLQAEAPAGATAVLSLAFVLGSAAGPLAGLGSLLWTGGSTGFALGVAAASLPLILAYTRLRAPAAPTREPGAQLVQGDTAQGGCKVVREIGLLCGVLVLLVGLEIGFSTWAYTLLGAPTGVAGTLAATVPLVFWLALALGALRVAIGARMGWRVPTFADVPRAGLISAGALAAFTCSSQVMVALVAAAVAGWAVGPVFPITAVRAMHARPSAAGRISGAIAAATQIGAMALPALGGLLVAHGRLAGGSILVATCLGLALFAQAALGTRTQFLPSRSPAIGRGKRARRSVALLAQPAIGEEQYPAWPAV